MTRTSAQKPMEMPSPVVVEASEFEARRRKRALEKVPYRRGLLDDDADIHNLKNQKDQVANV
jgi:hypothetical protein